MKIKLSLLFLLLLLISEAEATTFYVSNATGNDANPGTIVSPWKTLQHATNLVGTTVLCGDHVQARGGLHQLAATWTMTAANSGCAGNPIIYENFPAEVPIITGTSLPTALPAWTVDATVNCGPGCTAYFVDLDFDPTHTPHFVNFASLFYNGVRRPRPKGSHLNACPNTDDTWMCVVPAPIGTGGCTNTTQCANVACGAPATGLNGSVVGFISKPCATTPVQKYRCFNRAKYNGTDVDPSWTGFNRHEIDWAGFEIWSMHRMHPDTAVAGNLQFTAPTGLSDSNTGCLPGHNYTIENVKELASAGTWYLDTNPGNPNATTTALTQRLWVYASVGEDPNIDTIVFPQLPRTSRLIDGANVQHVLFQGLTFNGDNWYPDPLFGLPDVQGIPGVPPAIWFRDSSDITFTHNKVYHIQGWGIGFTGGNTTCPVSDPNNPTWCNQITYNSIYDIGAGGILIGRIACPSPGAGNNCSPIDTDTNVPANILVAQNKVHDTGQIQPTGEATQIYVGDAHGIHVDHNTVKGGLSGGINLGHGLNISSTFFMYDNWATWNDISGKCVGSQCSGNMADIGGIYSAPSHSIKCPPGPPSLGPPNTFCTHILNNTIHDLASNFNDTLHRGITGVYLDQGATNVEVRNNLIYRIAAECLQNNTPSHTAPLDLTPQDNLFENNICALIGSSQYNGAFGRSRIFNRGGNNARSFTANKNIFFLNSSNGNKIQSSPGHWNCFNDAGTLVVPCTDRFTFKNTMYFDTAGAPLDWVTCTTNLCTTMQHYSSMPWGGTPPTEDVTGPGQKSIIADPQFINPIYGTDNWFPTNTTAMAAIGFQMWDYTQAGANLNTDSVPSTGPSTFPLRLIDSATDYITSYSPVKYTKYGSGGLVGQTVVREQPGGGPPPPPPFAGDDKYCPVSEIPFYAGQKDGPAALPTRCVHTSIVDTPSPGTVVTVTAGSFSDLQAKVNAALCGQTIKVPAAVGGVQQSYAGNLVIPAKACTATNWLTIETDLVQGLPPEGSMVNPSYAGDGQIPGRPNYIIASAIALPELIGSGTNSKTVTFTAGGSFIRLLGFEITNVAGTVNGNAVVQTDGTDHVILDRLYIHPGDSATAQSGAANARLGISNNGTYQAIIGSYVVDFHCDGASCVDAQGVIAGVGTTAQGPFKWVDTFFEATGESFFAGGGAATIIPLDFEVRLNQLWHPLFQKTDDPSYFGFNYRIKNNGEFKNGSRILIEGNTFSNNWFGQADQFGNIFLLTPKNPNDTCPICSVTDVTIRFNKFQHSSRGIQISAVRATQGNTLPGALQRIKIHDNIFDDIDGYKWTTNHVGGCCSTSQGINTSNDNPQATAVGEVTVDHNTFVQTLSGPWGLSANNMTGIALNNNISGVLFDKIVWINNISAGGARGTGTIVPACPNCSTFSGMTSYTQNWCFDNNLIPISVTVGQKANDPYPGAAGGTEPSPACPHTPKGSLSVTDYTGVGFVNYNSGSDGDYHLTNTSPGHLAGTDGKDIGADIDLVNQYLAGGGATQYDMLDWMTMDAPLRDTSHMAGTHNLYTSILPTKFYWTKAAAGFPWDVQLYDSNYIYQWITELSWSDPNTFKKFNDGLQQPNSDKEIKFSPRFAIAGFPGTTTQSFPSTFEIHTSCTGFTSTNLGHVKTELWGPYKETFGGDLPANLDTLVLRYYWSCDANYANCATQERYHFSKPHGLIEWENYSLQGGNYVLQQTSLFNQIRTGTTTVNFPCF